MAPVDLIKADPNEFIKFLDSFDHVFSDCDGVLWLGAVTGAGDFMNLVKKAGKTVHYISNNSTRTKEEYKEHFDSVGIENGVENLTIPSIAIAEYLKSINFNKYVYCVTCWETQKTLEASGIKCKYGPEVAPDNITDFNQYFVDDPDIGAVVFDSDFKANLAKLYKAHCYLKRPEVLFLSGPTDLKVPFKTFGYTLGAAVFTQALIDEVKRQPIGMGKPSKAYGEFAMKRAGVTDPSRVLFIGDMIEQDIALGKNVGFKTMLVLTHFSEQEMKANDIKPDYYAPSLGSLVPRMKDMQK